MPGRLRSHPESRDDAGPAGASRLRASPLRAARAVLLAAALCACGASEDADAGGASRPAGATSPSAATPADPVATRSGPGPKAPTGRAASPPATPDPSLPVAPPLGVDAARDALVAAGEAADTDPELALLAAAYLAESGDADGVRRVAGAMLRQGDGVGGYEDPELAAAALAALVRIGDTTASARILALGRAAVADGDVESSLVAALGSMRGAEAADARALLLQMTQDDFVYGEAVGALAGIAAADAAAQLHAFATDEQEEGSVRAAAAAGLIVAGDPRGASLLDALVAAASDDLAAFDVIDGLGVRGAASVAPAVHKLLMAAVEDGNWALEARSAAASLVEIRGPGAGTSEDLALLRGLIGRDEGIADDHVQTALWALGDDAQAEAVARALTRWVVSTSPTFDADDAVWMLERIAARKAAGHPQLTKIVDAAAAAEIPDDPKRKDRADAVRRVRLAAAHARAASR